MKSPIEELWYGNLSPQEQYLEGNEEYKNHLKDMSKKQETLETTLTEKQKQLFAEYEDSAGKLSIISEAEAFRCGFSLGSLIMIDILK